MSCLCLLSLSACRPLFVSHFFHTLGFSLWSFLHLMIIKKKEEQVATRERETPHSSPYFFFQRSRVPIVSFSHATTAKIITPVTTTEESFFQCCLSQHTAIGFGHRKPEVLVEYFCFFLSRRAVSHKKIKIFVVDRTCLSKGVQKTRSQSLLCCIVSVGANQFEYSTVDA